MEDLDRLAAARTADDRSIYLTLEQLSAATIGHRLFTVTRYDPDRAEVERVHSSDPTAYPVGGRKRKHNTAWADQVLGAMKVFLATTPRDIQAAFDDHETILGLGIGSILNVPITHQGRCVGTMNLCHEAGWYQPQDEGTGLTLAPYLVPALLTGGLK